MRQRSSAKLQKCLLGKSTLLTLSVHQLARSHSVTSFYLIYTSFNSQAAMRSLTLLLWGKGSWFPSHRHASLSTSKSQSAMSSDQSDRAEMTRCANISKVDLCAVEWCVQMDLFYRVFIITNGLKRHVQIAFVC